MEILSNNVVMFGNPSSRCIVKMIEKDNKKDVKTVLHHKHLATFNGIRMEHNKTVEYLNICWLGKVETVQLSGQLFMQAEVRKRANVRLCSRILNKRKLSLLVEDVSKSL